MQKYSGIMGDSPSHISLNNKFDKNNFNENGPSNSNKINAPNTLTIDSFKSNSSNLNIQTNSDSPPKKKRITSAQRLRNMTAACHENDEETKKEDNSRNPPT